MSDNFSKADEIKKLKDLLDSGVLTQEEFEQQKTQLLYSRQPSSYIINPNSETLPTPKKKGRGCLIAILIYMFVLAITSVIGTHISSPSSSTNSSSKISSQAQAVKVVFDAKKFIGDDGKPLGEKAVMEMLGEPDSIDDWNYQTPTASYPIHTLIYGDYEYHFNNDTLQRIATYESIPYSNKEDILAMFGLAKTSISRVTDTGVAYRVTDCGVHDFWVPDYTDGTLDMVKISYGTLFDGE